MQRSDLWQLLALGAVVMGLAQTVAKERIFQPLRDRLRGKETWLGYLVSCPYCLSHWFAFLLVPVTGADFVRVSPRLGEAAPFVAWFLSSILVVVVAAFLRVGFWLVDEQQGLIRRTQRVTDEELAQKRLEREQLERAVVAARPEPQERRAH